MSAKELICVILLAVTFSGCNSQTNVAQKANPQATTSSGKTESGILTGADQLDLLLPRLKGKNVALVVNNTSLIRKTHLADTLLSMGIMIKKIFAPEHGFRGTADAGEQVKDGVDVKTGLALVSLYGSNKKPTAEQLTDVDVLVFDIQDVGVRFYTYISTMHYVMEACAENNKQLIILDRPNPNGNYVDGPVLEPAWRSFLGMHEIPVVHGLTVGELARMINGEKWLSGGIQCSLEIIPLKNWSHEMEYSLPAKPSPNLPNDQAIRLYPSTGLFEGTYMSLGRGTQFPFQVIGHPELTNMPFEFTPVTIVGMAKNPVHENKVCKGIDLRSIPAERKLDLQYLLKMYQAFPDKTKFFNDKSFDTHLGTSKMREMIVAGKSENEIRESWKKGLDEYKLTRQKYLLYP